MRELSRRISFCFFEPTSSITPRELLGKRVAELQLRRKLTQLMIVICVANKSPSRYLLDPHCDDACSYFRTPTARKSIRLLTHKSTVYS